MSDEEPEDAERERPPIHVVDKRISARGADAPRRSGPVVENPPPAATSQQEEGIWTPQTVEGGAEAEAEEGMDDEARRIAQQIIDVPSPEWIVNVAVTMANVAGAKLDAGRFDDGKLAIDALAGLINSTGEHLAGAEAPLRQTLAQLQMAYAERATGSS